MRVSRRIRLSLGKNLDRAIAAGHPWIYREALSEHGQFPAGQIIEIVSSKGRFLASGYWDPESAIAVRLLSREEHEEIDEAFFARQVAAAARLRDRVIDPVQTNAYRLLHGEADGLPGFVCDRYGEALVLRLDCEGARALLPLFLPALPPASCVLSRPRGSFELLSGRLPGSELEVVEHGMRFSVDIVAGQKTGLFLDQRENRLLVRHHAKAGTFLNLFCYTGGFSLAAALGGAKQSISVDSAAPVEAAFGKNLELNGLSKNAHRFVCEDAFDFLKRSNRRGETFDFVLVDPPSFAPNEESRERAIGAYTELNTLALSVLKREGLFATSSCSSHISEADLLSIVAHAAARAARRVRFFEIRGAGPDHPVTPAHPEGRYLKFFLGEAQ